MILESLPVNHSLRLLADFVVVNVFTEYDVKLLKLHRYLTLLFELAIFQIAYNYVVVFVLNNITFKCLSYANIFF